jgi:hypothetical protein
MSKREVGVRSLLIHVSSRISNILAAETVVTETAARQGWHLTHYSLLTITPYPDPFRTPPQVPEQQCPVDGNPISRLLMLEQGAERREQIEKQVGK